jgi:hypothetical protein
MAIKFVSIMDSVEEYTRRLTKPKEEELDTLSESKIFENYKNRVFIICRVKYVLFILSLRSGKCIT